MILRPLGYYITCNLTTAYAAIKLPIMAHYHTSLLPDGISSYRLSPRGYSLTPIYTKSFISI